MGLNTLKDSGNTKVRGTCREVLSTSVFHEVFSSESLVLVPLTVNYLLFVTLFVVKRKEVREGPIERTVYFFFTLWSLLVQ